MTSVPRIYPIILSGGSGTRLWPVSRKASPKQFARILGEESPFQAAARRTTGDAFEAPIIVTGEAYRIMVVEQLAAISISATAILIEPEPRIRRRKVHPFLPRRTRCQGQLLTGQATPCRPSNRDPAHFCLPLADGMGAP